MQAVLRMEGGGEVNAGFQNHNYNYKLSHAATGIAPLSSRHYVCLRSSTFQIGYCILIAALSVPRHPSPSLPNRLHHSRLPSHFPL